MQIVYAFNKTFPAPAGFAVNDVNLPAAPLTEHTVVLKCLKITCFS